MVFHNCIFCLFVLCAKINKNSNNAKEMSKKKETKDLSLKTTWLKVFSPSSSYVPPMILRFTFADPIVPEGRRCGLEANLQRRNSGGIKGIKKKRASSHDVVLIDV